MGLKQFGFLAQKSQVSILTLCISSKRLQVVKMPFWGPGMLKLPNSYAYTTENSLNQIFHGIKVSHCFRQVFVRCSGLWFYLPSEIHVSVLCGGTDTNCYFSAMRSPIELKLGGDLGLVSQISVHDLVLRFDYFLYCKQTKEQKTRENRENRENRGFTKLAFSPIDLKLGGDIRASTRNSVVCLFCLYYCLFILLFVYIP
jgi:hypothetical protein